MTEKDGFVGLSWEAPTEGEQGGVFDKNDLSYIVLDSESNIITRVRDNDIQLGDITVRHELSGGRSLVA